MLVKRNLDLVVVAFLVLALVMYDVALEILMEVLHLLFEIVHNLFEWIELGIEHGVEHLFHPSRHGSQIITFYILCTLAALLFWRIRRLPLQAGQICKRLALESWDRRKTQLQLYWLELSPLHKAVVVVAALAVGYLASFFVM